MRERSARSARPLVEDDPRAPSRIAESALAPEGRAAGPAGLRGWLADLRHRVYTHVRHVPLDSLEDWSGEPGTGNIRHRSGRFFTLEGLEAHIPGGPVASWSQPIIDQPEIGILGILAKEFDGVLHFLMQAKAEPGNCNGLQLCPTVQATRSNYSGVHRGRAVPYIEYFRDPPPRSVIADVRQSEQGSWFYRKRNRNMVVEVAGDVEALDGFRWLTLGQLHRLLAEDDLVNADARTVLSCLPFAGPDLAQVYPEGTAFQSALVRSFTLGERGAHSLDEVLSWMTAVRARTDVHTRKIALSDVRRWLRTEDTIVHETGRFFSVIGVDVAAGGREVGRWSQPMIQPHGTGVVAFLVRPIGGVLHALVHARVEPGYVDVLELAPTVQCTPANYEVLPAGARPRHLDLVLDAAPERVRFEATLSEEGGRFYHARNRYMIVEVGDLDPADLEHPDYRWLTLGQLVELLRHSHYVNIQARSLVACLHSLSTDDAR
ncbi:NDP-hexose 2,3-dehydratase family protein [Spirillospora sp. NPDC127200]